VFIVTSDQPGGRRQDREAKGKQAGNFLLIKFRDGIKFE
jgi:hypothetical protein